MTASLNYGFVTYFNIDDNIKEGIIRIFEKISQPLLKSTALAFEKPDILNLIPAQYPSVFAGSYFFVAGRYQTPGTSSVLLSGEGPSDTAQYIYNVNFSQSNEDPKFPEFIWAKEVMDALERDIEVYGVTQQKKDSLINLSLRYGMRCMYTAYIADYTTTVTFVEQVDETTIVPVTYIAGNYPNPFNPSTTIRFYLDKTSEGKVILLKFYNVLGQLIRVIDVSSFKPGWHEVLFNAEGLSSGVYIVSLETENTSLSRIKVVLTK